MAQVVQTPAEQEVTTGLAAVLPHAQQWIPPSLLSAEGGQQLPASKAMLPSKAAELRRSVDRQSVPLCGLLEQTTINSFVGDRQRNIITVPEDMTLEHCMGVLSHNHILSVPVRCKDSRDLMGFVDVLDILCLFVRTCTEGHNVEEAKWSEWCKDVETLSHKGRNFASVPVSLIADASQVDPFFPVYGNGTLAQLIEHFSKGIHRAAVYNKLKTVVHDIVSQSDVLNFMMGHVHRDLSVLGVLRNKTVDELNLGTRPAITVSINEKAIHALYLLAKHRVSAVAIVDEAGQLVANFSASEVRGLGLENFGHLLKPVMQFLIDAKNAPGALKAKGLKAPITCTPETTLETVMLKLNTYRVHRLWIVGENNKPIGVISLTDLMRLFASGDGDIPADTRSTTQEK